MTTKIFNPKTYLLLAFIVVVGAVRTYLSMDESMFGLSNFSPIGAMAIFNGAYFKRTWKAILFPILTLLASDVVLQFAIYKTHTFLYHGWYYVYFAFLLMIVVGKFIKAIKPFNIFIAAISITLIHWLITDFGVWLNSKTFAQTPAGYVDCLVVAIPFEWRLLAGTLVYSAVLFVGFELLNRRLTVSV